MRGKYEQKMTDELRVAQYRQGTNFRLGVAAQMSNVASKVGINSKSPNTFNKSFNGFWMSSS
jgi:hypothetical protein